MYRIGDLTPQYRIKDMFMWNLHESLITPDHFARTLVDELDLPQDKKPSFIHQISLQIRTQLEEYAGIALHPLFYNSSSALPAAPPQVAQKAASALDTPGNATPQLNGLANGLTNGNSTPAVDSQVDSQPDVEISATAELASKPYDDALNPDDTYRCVIGLSVNILNKLYSDKFEWSLLHPTGYAETFAKVTCADLGLAPEWAPAIAHAIYEATLRLKKEVCENGGVLGNVEIENDAAEGVEAGWRYEPEALADEWEPKLEVLSKDEIDRREGDRERQIRRQRRETARFSSTTGVGGMSQGDYFAPPDISDQPLGRGERSKKKRRFRSLSPNGRDTPDATGGYGGGTGLQER
jgi:chromatin structure-remodeling complex subunit SFH1